MLRLCALVFVAIIVASCCRPCAVMKEQHEMPSGAMNASVLVDDDTIVPPPDTSLINYPLPVQVYEPVPEYPRLAGAKGIESSVILQVFVDKHGFVRRANAVKCTHPGYGFEEAAIAAAYGSKWKSAMDNNGNPIGVWVAYKIEFALKK
ncbi:MAG: TonB family protein [candidate division Zixibacteria bacterium]|nr:TonB family protein [candidate division Zixibacteria bacterium]